MYASVDSLNTSQSKKTILAWRIVQALVWLVGVVILSALLFFPKIGVMLFWNILIPVAPALLVLAVGVWRNVCPLATTTLLPRHFGISQKRVMSNSQLAKLNLVGIVALYSIVPLRHALFNHSGVATGVMLLIMIAIGISMSFFFEWKSAWCSSLCPIHPVEKLYGSNVLFSVKNAHCDKCRNCVIPCPDSTPNMQPKAAKNVFHQINGILIVGGLPGFIWGWFHVPDEIVLTDISTFLSVYQYPLAGMFVTLVIYNLLLNTVNKKYELLLVRISAAASVSCYYWYRVPSLLGFGKFADDGLLINLQGIIPAWSITAFICILTVFFFYRLVLMPFNKKSWVIRPEFAIKS